MSHFQNNKENFTIIPNMILDIGLSQQAERLYIHIRRRTGDDGSCWKSQDNLAKDCRMTAKTVVKAKQELKDAGLIEIERSKIGKHSGHVIKLIDIWEINSYFKASKKNVSGVKETPRCKMNIDMSVKEPPRAEATAVENNHCNNISSNNIHDINIPHEFVLKIPGQDNREHERTPGAVAVMQIYRASPGISKCAFPGYSKQLTLKDKPVNNYVISSAIKHYESILGISVVKTCEIWRSEGKPIINLGQGESCTNIEHLLSHSDVLDRHVIAIKAWLNNLLIKNSK